jgi:preprotein translocase subunit SecA
LIFNEIDMSFFSRFFKDPDANVIAEVRPIIERINTLEQEYQALSEDAIQAKTAEFRSRLEAGESLDDVLPEAYAVVKNVSRRLVGTSWPVRGEENKWVEIPYDEQIIGAILLHRGQIVEMKTGEGKTLVSTMPVYLNALAGKGVHVITVNEYLARRDAEWVGKIHEYLGLTVGVSVHGDDKTAKRAAYAADITYGTNNEFGFDYLRDNMAMSTADKVQRGLAYGIVDEVDSILIDEARTPLIISAPAERSTSMYERFVQIVPQLNEGEHYNVDEKSRSVALTEGGLDAVEKILGEGSIYNAGGVMMVHHLEAALKAHALFKRDRDYVVKDDQIVIVDEFTGRLMAGRRYSEGLHQAIEAKEGVRIQRESRTLATITFQNYFRMYDKLSGMTGTAVTQAEEFSKVYKLDVTAIPTHHQVIRQDLTDRIFKTENGKFQAVAREVKARHEHGQPVLLGTISIEKSERLSDHLRREGVPHEVLNAKFHEKEAKIIEHAGQRGVVTIATNMAGRGTDIKLGAGVKELGGLVVIGTERHESRRIDNQLRGRSGRQGDPGLSQFYVSLEDDLMRIFGSERVQGMMNTLGVPEDQPIENRFISRSLENAQKKVEANNFDVRKHLLEYDDVMNKQRQVLYRMRDDILEAWEAEKKVHDEGVKSGTEAVEEYLPEDIDTLRDRVLDMIETNIEEIVLLHTQGKDDSNWNLEEIAESAAAMFRAPSDLPKQIRDLEERSRGREGDAKTRDAIISLLISLANEAYEAKEAEIGLFHMREIEKIVLLRSIDVLWIEHLEAMERLREGIGLQGYGQRDPLVEYKKEGYQLFQEFLYAVGRQVTQTIYKIEVNRTAGATPMERQQDMQTSGGEAAKTAGPVAAVKQEKVGRNDPCWCGSGKKYKRCHGA